MISDFRCIVGEWLISLALSVFPKGSTERKVFAQASLGYISRIWREKS